VGIVCIRIPLHLPLPNHFKYSISVPSAAVGYLYEKYMAKSQHPFPAGSAIIDRISRVIIHVHLELFLKGVSSRNGMKVVHIALASNLSFQFLDWTYKISSSYRENPHKHSRLKKSRKVFQLV
jgi:hypothetical protein